MLEGDSCLFWSLTQLSSYNILTLKKINNGMLGGRLTETKYQHS